MLNTVELYTRQHENSIFEIIKKGYMTNKEIYVRLHMKQDANYFMDRYRYFSHLASKIVPRPQGTEYPIWTSISKNNCLKTEYNSLIYCLQVPRDQVVYLDGSKWDYVLNYLYIPKDDEDKKAYRAELKRLNIDNEYKIFKQYKGYYPEIESKIQASWQRVFDIEAMDEYIIQANIWRIQADWIQRVIHPGDNIFAPPERSLNLQRDADWVKQRQALRQEKN